MALLCFFFSFEIGGVAVTASSFFLVHHVLGLLFGWMDDTTGLPVSIGKCFDGWVLEMVEDLWLNVVFLDSSLGSFVANGIVHGFFKLKFFSAATGHQQLNQYAICMTLVFFMGH
ncbi:hypothetical protein Ahy_B03g062184 isoform C [Arachis hypogaea]|uniref:Uncharacterized protein n=1 Tax=Arachis hypogaea TaxID=3818 RepID=A0A444ZTM7_ARAHY|nr:hypothetical protein Ahy_B03g062184 isoform C [Arachis hypogaea]